MKRKQQIWGTAIKWNRNVTVAGGGYRIKGCFLFSFFYGSDIIVCFFIS